MSDNNADKTIPSGRPWQGSPAEGFAVPSAGQPPADEGGAQIAVWLSQADVQALEFLRLTLRIPARGGPRGGLQGRAGALVAAVRIASKSAAAAPKAALIAAGFTASEATKRLDIGKRSAETRAKGRELNARVTLEQHKAKVDAQEPFFTPEGASPPTLGPDPHDDL
jgi:hypothetical protein